MSLRAIPPEIIKAFLRKEMENAHIIDFERIGMWQVADEELLREFADKMDWHSVFHHIQCSQDFLREVLNNHYDDVDFDTEYLILTQDVVDEKFIEEVKDKIDWRIISRIDKITEDFIERHAEDVNWNFISQNPNLSTEFLEKYEEMLNWSYVIHNNKHVTKEMKERHKDEILWMSDR